MARGRPSTGKGPGRGVKPTKTAAWQWAEHTEPKNITKANIEAAYRIHTAPCVRGSCRVNCKFNPNCLNGLGEKLWLGEIQDNYWHNLEDPESEKRAKDAFVGLKNLGATCYVNTFLQLWFHNTSLRSALYRWTNLDSTNKDDKTNCGGEDRTKNGNQENMELDDKNPEDEKSSIKNEETLEKGKATSSTPTKKMPPLLPSSCISTEDADKFTNICAHLQLIFAQLQYSSRRYIDPTSLIHSLGLDTAQQQDAQEFSKLFMSLLESTLSEQPNPEVREVIEKQFGGKYFYVTKCDKCGNKSKQLSKFYELDLNIQGHSSLSQCIKEFLKEEELTGDNQYYCMACDSKQNAKRYMEIHSLPPVLNLQLLRFVFDRKTGYKKKLHSDVQFPDVLNMNEILKDDISNKDNAPVYELTAVLMHHGTSAYSGHYVAHIREKETNTWYKFNDEDIEKMQNKLKLSGEDESEPGEKPAKRPKCSKGYHTSRNAYMLVYTRKTDEDLPRPVVEVPEHLQELVAKDNSKFEEWITVMDEMKNDMISKGKHLQAEVQSILQMLPAKRDDYEWMSTEWLKVWLNDRVEVKPPIDHASFLCSHGKLNPEKVPNAKRISTKAADWFYTKYGGFPRLQRDSLCSDCVSSVCSQIRFKFRLSEDDKAIKAILKAKVDPQRVGKWFWIGKNSLISWKKLATLAEDAKSQTTDCNPLEDSEIVTSTPLQKTAKHPPGITTNGTRERSRKRKNNPSTCEEDDASSNEGGEKETRAIDTSSNRGDSSCQMDGSTSMDDSSRVNESSDEDEEEDLMKFNDDLLCEHGNLSATATCRKLVQESIWQRLIYYFDSAREFPEAHPVCQQCQAESEDERKNQELNKARATEERAALSNLYYNKHRPDLYSQDEEHSTLCVYAVSNAFLDRWRSFLRHWLRCARPDSISNQDLLCPHQRFMFNPGLRGEDGAHEVFSYLFKHEWDMISCKYPYDEIITITKEASKEEDNPSFITSPEICEGCHASRMLEKARSFENYRHATIFVRKITDEHDPNEIQKRFDEEVTDPDSPQDPDYSSSDNKHKSSSENSKRRSSRHRKQRGEVNLTVHSSQTLRDIKLELMKSFSVMPMDQHLSLKGTPLTDDAATLSRLGVRPGCLLMLKLDQPQGGGHPETLLAASTAPEKGFQGTGLLGH